jgi:hypothetical protein
MSTATSEGTAAAPQTSPLAALETVEETHKRAARIFPSVNSLRWAIRQHRRGLEAAGAILYLGRRMWVNPAQFDQYWLQAGVAAAQRRHGAGS